MAHVWKRAAALGAALAVLGILSPWTWTVLGAAGGGAKPEAHRECAERAGGEGVPDGLHEKGDKKEAKAAAAPEARREEASGTGAEKKVKWTVHFVDEEDWGRRLWPSQSGTIQAGGSLDIRFPTRIYGGDGSVWESLERSPAARLVSGPGAQVEYIEFRRGEDEGEEEPPAGPLAAFLGRARALESRLTGEEAGTIPDSRFIVSSQEENDRRVLSAASRIGVGKGQVFYVIGKNFMPNGKAVAGQYGSGAVYSNLLEETLETEGEVYYIARMEVQKETDPGSCIHQWEQTGEDPTGCLTLGEETYSCRLCEAEEKVARAPMGHADTDGDSVCDRCGMRAFEQKEGDQIRAVLGEREMTFTCIDEDYSGGMLYLADQSLELSWFGGYGPVDYGESHVFRYFRDGFQNGFSIKSGIRGISLEEAPGTAYAMSLSAGEYRQYRERIKGGGFLLRDSSGGKVWGVDQEGDLALEDTEATRLGIRPAVLLEKPEQGSPQRIHWQLGDRQAVQLEGETYMFRCIDEDYADGQENHRKAALFLCDSVIPADYGSDYQLRQGEDGAYEYVFCPGPVVNFGPDSDYKYSSIHRWLGEREKEIWGLEPVDIGVDHAYMGSSPEGRFSDFEENSLKASYVGDQKLTAGLFILSVDEAVAYREELWRFEGSREENPQSQYSAFCKGYWLRSPMGGGSGFDRETVYAVDLLGGNIRPAAVRPEGGTGNGELDVTSVYGIRPAFAMAQD